MFFTYKGKPTGFTLALIASFFIGLATTVFGYAGQGAHPILVGIGAWLVSMAICILIKSAD